MAETTRYNSDDLSEPGRRRTRGWSHTPDKVDETIVDGTLGAGVIAPVWGVTGPLCSRVAERALFRPLDLAAMDPPPSPLL